MTLIITASSPYRIVQVSDRRLLAGTVRQIASLFEDRLGGGG